MLPCADLCLNPLFCLHNNPMAGAGGDAGGGGEVLSRKRAYKEKWQEGVGLFNKKPKKGIALLQVWLLSVFVVYMKWLCLLAGVVWRTCAFYMKRTCTLNTYITLAQQHTRNHKTLTHSQLLSTTQQPHNRLRTCLAAPPRTWPPSSLKPRASTKP